MMLAIQGHSTRGSEVIALLEMLGGINTAHFEGENTELAYYIEVDRSICCIDVEFEYHTEFYKITLEEFEENFPYKVGYKVQHKGATSCGTVYKIEKIMWEDNQVKYTICNLYRKTLKCTVISKDLQPYKEETMETITIDDFKANTKEWLIDKLESMSKDNALQAICNIHDELHKPKYPKTYVECAKILNCFSASYIDGYRNELLDNLQELLICRDAYWKIYGEQMGLGKPWESNPSNEEQHRYAIYNYEGTITKNDFWQTGVNAILAFPTEEMRDDFFGNFKDLINECKELL